MAGSLGGQILNGYGERIHNGWENEFSTDGPGLGEAAFPTDNGLQRITDVAGGGVLAKGMGPSHPQT